MTSPLRSAWAEPRPPRPRTSRAADVVALAVPLVIAFFEAALRPELAGHGGSLLATLALAGTLLWRRTRPLLALAVAAVGLTVVSILSGGPDIYASVFVLGLAYAVVRWGSGREAVVGAVGMVAFGLVDPLVHRTPAGDVLGGLAILGASLALGVAMRYRARSRQRALDEVRLLEREQLARDLHDTVAHHVSAIAVRAQAGLAVAPHRPEAATEALAVIEAEASRTLAEMRTIVRALRRDEPGADVDAPQRRLADVALLADDAGPGPSVRVTVAGDVDAVAPSVGAAVYRIAQEAVTNARRHARSPRLVRVHAAVDGDVVRLVVTDDGEPPARASGEGYGLAGMRERAALLGGTCEAGPAPDGGWAVTATLPRTGPAS